MATLSHEALRRMIEKFGGCDEYFTEMINAGSLLTHGPFEKYYLISEAAPEKTVWQLTGGKADLLERAAFEIAERGGIGLDLNMGCSAPEIVASGAGIAWMQKPSEETRSMVMRVRKALERSAACGKKRLRLSAKIRLGDEGFSDDGFFCFCEMLSDEGVEMITLHPRTRRQKYSKAPHFSYVQRLSEIMHKRGVSVILNGDVCGAESAASALEKAPLADGIMIGRAAVQKPWVFMEIKRALSSEGRDRTSTSYENTLSTADLYALAFDYLQDLKIYQPKEFWRTRMQRFFTYYCQNFSFAHYCRTQLLNSKDMDEAQMRLLEYFEKVPEDRYVKIRIF
ncbi:tRNA-dihydrouridine synthase family protein [Treponema parvum]|uniref:tRNA-dihydrouridine synthase n=1 Tax=Treponema parvum TaxID=138851 RepID=A0A975F0I5_9SPIR|nr:tRNA-dihydrouridine synthase family protein [Treponema parvum]QTQ12341.1 tRNA-dihydrouridine synthase family protein [Treponema parvum]